jgi:hypothetical protein
VQIDRNHYPLRLKNSKGCPSHLPQMYLKNATQLRKFLGGSRSMSKKAFIAELASTIVPNHGLGVGSSTSSPPRDTGIGCEGCRRVRNADGAAGRSDFGAELPVTRRMRSSSGAAK